jgi:putative peptidoglycan lipid II flippase
MSLVRSTLLVSFTSLGVYVISFFNQILLARAFGNGPRMDAYLSATIVPLGISNLIIAAGSYTLVPFLVKLSESEQQLKKVRGSLFILFATIGIVLSMLGIVFHALPLSARGSYAAESYWAALFTWIGCFLFCLTTVSDAIFNVNKSFLFPILAYIPSYLLTALSSLFLAEKYGGAVIAAATTLGYLLFFPVRLMQQRKKIEIAGPLYSSVRSFLISLPITIVAVASLYLFPLVDNFWAPRYGESVLSTIGFCTRIISTLSIVVALGPFGVLIPQLSELSLSGNRLLFISRVREVLAIVLSLVLPLVIWIGSHAEVIVKTLLQRGNFTEKSTSDVSHILPIMLAGSVPMILSLLILRMHFADGKKFVAAIISVCSLCCYFVFSGLLLNFKTAGIPAAFLITWSISSLAGFLSLVPLKSISLDTKFVMRSLRFCALVLLIVFSSLLSNALTHELQGVWAVCSLGLSIVLIFSMYLYCGYLLNIDFLAKVFHSVKGRFLAHKPNSSQ